MWTKAISDRPQINCTQDITHTLSKKSQSMFEIQFILGIFDFMKYSLHFFLNLRLGNHLYTPKHTTSLHYFPSFITF